MTWGYLNSFGSFQTYYEQTMPDTPPSTISWIGSLRKHHSSFTACCLRCFKMFQYASLETRSR